MSRLDELKSGSFAPDDGIDIDMTAGIDGLDHSNEGNRINMAKPQKTSSARKTVSVAEMSKSFAKNEPAPEQQPNAIQDPDAVAKTLLYGEDNVMEKFLERKREEYNERMAQFEDERAALIEQGKLDPRDIKDPDFDKSKYLGDDEENPDNNIDDEEEEDDEMNENETNNQELVLDNDDLFEQQEEAKATSLDDELEDTDLIEEEEEELEVEDEKADDFGVVEDDASPKDEVKIEEKKEEPKEDKKVHITEEDKEVFDSIGGDVDSSRFIKDEEEEETPKKEEKKEPVESIDDDDDEEEDDSADDKSEETLKHLKELITDRLQPTFKKVDIGKFQIRTKKSSTSNIRSITDGQQLKVVKWVLPNQKQCVFMKQFTGLELQTLSENIQEGSMTSMNIAYRSIYDHIVSNKPAKFTDWLAVTPDSDIDHYMFCVFIASYKGTNFLPMDCPNDKCPDPTFLTDDIPIMDMVKFKNDEAKNKFMDIYKSEIVYSNKAGYYTTAITPVSKQIAIGFKESTLKDVIDIDGLDERFKSRYRTTVALIPFIDAIYQIDYDTNSLVQIAIKDTDNPVKTLRSKVRTYAKLIDTLTSDEFGVINAIIQDISNREDMLSYIVPEVECPACGRKIDEVATSATQLVFTRYQLGALVNTTLS